MTKFSILEKSRAPSRIEFRKGLVCEECRQPSWELITLEEPTEELGFVVRGGPFPGKNTPSGNSQDDTCHHVAVALEDLVVHNEVSYCDGSPVRVNSDPFLFAPERNDLQRVGVESLAELEPSQQQAEEQYYHHDCALLFRIHGSPLFLGVGMYYRATMTRFSYYRKDSIFGAVSKGQQKIGISAAFHPVTLWIKKFSSPKMRNREFVFAPKIPYDLVAEHHACRQAGSEANQNSLTFPTWCPRWDSNPQGITPNGF